MFYLFALYKFFMQFCYTGSLRTNRTNQFTKVNQTS